MSAEVSECVFCNRVACDSEVCARHEAELREEGERQHREDLAKAWRAAWSDRCRDQFSDWCFSGNWLLGLVQRWFYTLKALVCLELERSSRGVSWCADSVEVGCYHSAELYAGWEASWIHVGPGVFRNWWYRLESDGDWNM